MAEKSIVPPGVVGIFTSKDGHVIANASDFERSKAGGTTLREGQEYRVRYQLAFAVLRAYCSPDIAEVFEAYEASQVMHKMVKKGAKVTFIPIGHDTED